MYYNLKTYQAHENAISKTPGYHIQPHVPHTRVPYTPPCPTHQSTTYTTMSHTPEYHIHHHVPHTKKESLKSKLLGQPRPSILQAWVSKNRRLINLLILFNNLNISSVFRYQGYQFHQRISHKNRLRICRDPGLEYRWPWVSTLVSLSKCLRNKRFSSVIC